MKTKAGTHKKDEDQKVLEMYYARAVSEALQSAMFVAYTTGAVCFGLARVWPNFRNEMGLVPAFTLTAMGLVCATADIMCNISRGRRPLRYVVGLAVAIIPTISIAAFFMQHAR